MGSNQVFANASRIELGTANASRIIKLRIANQFASCGQKSGFFLGIFVKFQKNPKKIGRKKLLNFCAYFF